MVSAKYEISAPAGHEIENDEPICHGYNFHNFLLFINFSLQALIGCIQWIKFVETRSLGNLSLL